MRGKLFGLKRLGQQPRQRGAVARTQRGSALDIEAVLERQRDRRRREFGARAGEQRGRCIDETEIAHNVRRRRRRRWLRGGGPGGKGIGFELKARAGRARRRGGRCEPAVGLSDFLSNAAAGSCIELASVASSAHHSLSPALTPATRHSLRAACLRGVHARSIPAHLFEAMCANKKVYHPSGAVQHCPAVILTS